MKVRDLIKRLQAMDPETVVVKFAQPEGYDDVWFLDGTHTGHAMEEDFLRMNPARKRKQGDPPRPDYLARDNSRPSSAKRIPFLVIY